MPIEFTHISNDDKWAGSNWTVTDLADLAQHIARITLGQYRHVAKVLATTGVSTSNPHATAFAGARSMLISTQQDPWYRDGWIFR